MVITQTTEIVQRKINWLTNSLKIVWFPHSHLENLVEIKTVINGRVTKNRYLIGVI